MYLLIFNQYDLFIYILDQHLQKLQMSLRRGSTDGHK